MCARARAHTHTRTRAHMRACTHACARARAHTHTPIQIEIGRYTNIKRELRLCKLCLQNKVEDEAHFLFVCPILDTERERFYAEHIDDQDAFKKLKDMDKIAFLLSKDNVKKLDIFLESMLYNRRQTLFVPN